MVRFLGVMIGGFLEDGVKTYLMAPMSPLNSAKNSCLYIYSLCFAPVIIQREDPFID
jgi:hypothetical protein